jgi:hypothetical protein
MTQSLRLLNPLTGEVKLISALSRACIRKLKAYGWREATLEEWFAYQRASIDYGLAKAQGTLVRH